MKYDIKKRNSNLEVHIKLKEYSSLRVEGVLIEEVPFEVVTSGKARDLLTNAGLRPGHKIDDTGTNKVSNAGWQACFNLDTVWVFEDLALVKETKPVATKPVETKPVAAKPKKSKQK